MHNNQNAVHSDVETTRTDQTQLYSIATQSISQTDVIVSSMLEQMYQSKANHRNLKTVMTHGYPCGMATDEVNQRHRATDNWSQRNRRIMFGEVELKPVNKFDTD